MTKSDSPRISILIPSFNGGPFLEETFDTILKQSYGDWEAVIMDGGSTDGSEKILKRYAAKDSRFRVFFESDEGPYHAIHKALAKARGEFTFVLAISDGYLDAEWFKKCLDVVDKDKEVSLVWGIPMDATEDGEIIGPAYVYAHFLERGTETGYGRTDVVSRIASRVDWRPSTWARLVKKLNRGNLRTFFRMMRGRGRPPEKRAWFRYWLGTGQIFPDGNTCVATRVFRECLPPYRFGTREPGDWMGFYFNFNSRGYLAYCIPTPANFGRLHGGQISETMQAYNDANRTEYFQRLREFRRSYRKNPETFTFRDRNGTPLPG